MDKVFKCIVKQKFIQINVKKVLYKLIKKNR